MCPIIIAENVQLIEKCTHNTILKPHTMMIIVIG